MIETKKEAATAYLDLTYRCWEAEASDRECGEWIIYLARAGFRGEAQEEYESGREVGLPGKLFSLVRDAHAKVDVCTLGGALLADDPREWKGADAEAYAAHCKMMVEDDDANEEEFVLPADFPEKYKPLIAGALSCGHGEIFAENFQSASDGEPVGLVSRTLVEVTNEILDDQYTKEDAEEEGSTWHGIWKPSVTSNEEAVAIWEGYFKNYPSHGEYAGLVCSLLVAEKMYDDTAKILNICKSDGGFGWDS